MTRLLRRPLTWMIAAEALLVAALGLAAWHVFSTHQAAAPPTALAQGQPGFPPRPPLASPAHASPAASRPPSAQPSPARPGLATSDAFLSQQARSLNRDQAAWEAAQWSLVKAAVDAARTYLERVVAPAVDRAERSGGG